MARILFGLCSVGMGHAVRSKVLLDHLRKKHEVFIIASHRSYTYLSQYFDNVYNIEGFELAFEQNKVLTWKTIFRNLRKMNSQTYHRFLNVRKAIEQFKPELVLADWEPFASVVAYNYNLPLISVDNQHYLIYGKYEFPFSELLQYWKVALIVKTFMRRPHYFIVMLMPKTLLRTIKNTFGVLPVLRSELFHIKPKKENYILVYQSTKTYQKLIEILKQLPEQFVIYGFDRESQEGNLTFKRFDDKARFLTDLAHAKAVITTGGFTLISESVYLHKPMLIVPIEKHFEQFLNAEYVKQHQYGDSSRDLTAEKIKQFLGHLPQYQNFPERWTNQQFYNAVDKVITLALRK